LLVFSLEYLRAVVPVLHFGKTLFFLLLIQPLVTGRHFATIYNARFGYVILTKLLRFLFAISLLGALNSRTRLGKPGLSVKGYAIGLVPPDGCAIAIPVLQKEVCLG
jgi:hypothetical protein